MGSDDPVADVGHRATGTRAGSFLLLPPGEERTGGDDASVIRFPTAVASIVGPPIVRRQ